MNASNALRDDDINFGDRTKLEGSTSKSLAIVTLAGSRPLTVYADVTKTTGPTPAAIERVVPIVTIEWGSGAASAKAEYRLAGRLRVPLVARSITVDGRLVDRVTGGSPPANVVMEVSVFIACGTDGQTILNTRTVVQTGADGVLSARSERVLAVSGHNGAASNVWIMLFEGATAPAAGDVPRMAAPAPAMSTFRMRPASPRDFASGVRWAASSAPLAFAPAAGASLFVEAELLP